MSKNKKPEIEGDVSEIMNADSSVPVVGKTRMINGRVVAIVEKSPEERLANFIATVNHESNRVSDWSAKLLNHVTSTTYPLSNEAIDAILAKYEKDYMLFVAGVEKFRARDKKVEKVGLLTIDSVVSK